MKLTHEAEKNMVSTQASSEVAISGPQDGDGDRKLCSETRMTFRYHQSAELFGANVYTGSVHELLIAQTNHAVDGKFRTSTDGRDQRSTPRSSGLTET